MQLAKQHDSSDWKCIASELRVGGAEGGREREGVRGGREVKWERERERRDRERERERERDYI